MSIPIFRRATSNYIRLFDTVKRFTLLITYSDYVRVVTIARIVQTSRSRPSANLCVPVLVRHTPTSHCSVYWDCRVPLPCDYSISHLNLIVNTPLRRTTSKPQCRACSSAYTYGARIRSTSAAWLTSQRTVSSFSSAL